MNLRCDTIHPRITCICVCVYTRRSGGVSRTEEKEKEQHRRCLFVSHARGHVGIQRRSLFSASSPRCQSRSRSSSRPRCFPCLLPGFPLRCFLHLPLAPQFRFSSLISIWNMPNRENVLDSRG